MMITDTKEKGLETLIVDWLREQNGYEQGLPAEYNKDYANKIKKTCYTYDTSL